MVKHSVFVAYLVLCLTLNGSVANRSCVLWKGKRKHQRCHYCTDRIILKIGIVETKTVP